MSYVTYKTKLKLDKEVGGGVYNDEVFVNAFQEVFQDVFQEVFQNVFQEIVRKLFQEVFLKVCRQVLHEMFRNVVQEVTYFKKCFNRYVKMHFNR